MTGMSWGIFEWYDSHMNYNTFGPHFGTPAWIPLAGFVFILLALWSIFWKGVALWNSAERKQTKWFIAILLLNTAGLLEIFYLFAVLKLSPKSIFRRLRG